MEAKRKQKALKRKQKQAKMAAAAAAGFPQNMKTDVVSASGSGGRSGDDNSNLSSDARIDVVELATGKIFSGDEAPLASQLESWLEANRGLALSMFFTFIARLWLSSEQLRSH